MNLNLQICSQGEEQNNNKNNHEFCVLSKYHKYKHFFIILDIENMNCAQNCHSLKKKTQQNYSTTKIQDTKIYCEIWNSQLSLMWEST